MSVRRAAAVLLLLAAPAAAQTTTPTTPPAAMQRLGAGLPRRCGVCHLDKAPPAAAGPIAFVPPRGAGEAGAAGMCFTCHNGIVDDRRRYLATGRHPPAAGRVTCGSFHTPHVREANVGAFMRFPAGSFSWCASYVFIDKVGYQNIPSGAHRFSLKADIPYVIPGPWQVAWNSPLLSGSAQTAGPKACVTRDMWDQLATQTDPLPSDLGGKLLVMTPEENSTFVRTLDGINSQELGDGNWYSLSKDGTRLAYAVGKDLHVLDLSTGQDSMIGTFGTGEIDMIWSPDGTRILYTDIDSLYVINADGSEQIKVDDGLEIAVVGWLPDSQTVVYAARGDSGFELKR